jgi:hypothetical protein
MPFIDPVVFLVELFIYVVPKGRIITNPHKSRIVSKAPTTTPINGPKKVNLGNESAR